YSPRATMNLVQTFLFFVACLGFWENGVIGLKHGDERRQDLMDFEQDLQSGATSAMLADKYVSKIYPIEHEEVVADNVERLHKFVLRKEPETALEPFRQLQSESAYDKIPFVGDVVPVNMEQPKFDKEKWGGRTKNSFLRFKLKKPQNVQALQLTFTLTN